MDAVAKLSQYIEGQSYEMRVVGVPKTIDNDLPGRFAGVCYRGHIACVRRRHQCAVGISYGKAEEALC